MVANAQPRYLEVMVCDRPFTRISNGGVGQYLSMGSGEDDQIKMGAVRRAVVTTEGQERFHRIPPVSGYCTTALSPQAQCGSPITRIGIYL